MYPKWMLNLLLYFDLWGFCTQFNRSPNSNQVKIDRLIFIFHMIFASIATLFICNYLKRPDNDTLANINDVLKFTDLLLVYWLSIFELYTNRRIQKEFWSIVRYIDKRFCSLQRFDLGHYPLKIKIYFTLTILNNCIFFNRIFSTARTDFVYLCLCYMLITWIHQNRSFYYLFYLEWIRQELKRVNYEAHEIVATYESSLLRTRNAFMKIFHRNRFKWLRQYYGSTYDLSDEMNMVFGWSNVAVILVSVHLILADVNWFYWKLFNKNNPSIIRKKISIDSVEWNICKFKFNFKLNGKFQYFPEYSIWFLLLGLIIVFVFRASSACFRLVKTFFVCLVYFVVEKFDFNIY